MDGLQKGNEKINHFSPVRQAEAANTCRRAESAVTCQQAGGWAPTDCCLFAFFLPF